MGGYHWIMAVEDHRCRMCGVGIKRAEFFYYKTGGGGGHYCRDCGRAIRQHGEEKAGRLRNPLSFLKGGSPFGDVFGGMFGGL